MKFAEVDNQSDLNCLISCIFYFNLFGWKFLPNKFKYFWWICKNLTKNPMKSFCKLNYYGPAEISVWKISISTGKQFVKYNYSTCESFEFFFELFKFSLIIDRSRKTTLNSRTLMLKSLFFNSLPV